MDLNAATPTSSVEIRPGVAPIPSIRRVVRVEENTAAELVVLTADQLIRPEALTMATGARHDEATMMRIDR